MKCVLLIISLYTIYSSEKPSDTPKSIQCNLNWKKIVAKNNKKWQFWTVSVLFLTVYQLYSNIK